MSAPDPTVPPFLLRGLARLIDIGVQLAVIELAFQLSRFLPDITLLTLSDNALWWVDLATGMSALFAYTTISEWLGGATVGKLLTRMRVVLAADGEPLDLRAAALRSLLFYVDGLFFGIVAHGAIRRSARGQRIGDEVAGTVVVWRQEESGTRARWAWIPGVLVALSLVLVSYIIAS